METTRLQEAYRGLAFLERAGISDQGNNNNFCFLALEGIHCTDTNLGINQDGGPSEFDNVTNVSCDLDLSETCFAIACQAHQLELLFIALIYAN